MSISEGLQLLKLWEAIHDTPEVQGRAQYFSTELKREVPTTHVLFGKNATALALRLDRDDVLSNSKGKHH